MKVMCECCYNGREQCCCCGNAAMVVGITGVFCNCICCGRAPAYCHCCCCCRRRVCGAPPDRVHRWNEAAGRALHEVELTRAALKDIHANVQHLVAVSAKDQGRFQALARLRQVERECAVRMQDLAAALMQQPLVANYTEASNWAEWFAGTGVVFEPKVPYLMVDTLAVALEMALAGRGVALVNGPFADADLAAGRLVRPVDRTVVCPGAWGLICRRSAVERLPVRLFIDWLSENQRLGMTS